MRAGGRLLLANPRGHDHVRAITGAGRPLGKPLLVRLHYDGGHSDGSGEKRRHEEAADIWSFLPGQFAAHEFRPHQSRAGTTIRQALACSSVSRRPRRRFVVPGWMQTYAETISGCVDDCCFRMRISGRRRPGSGSDIY